MTPSTLWGTGHGQLVKAGSRLAGRRRARRLRRRLAHVRATTSPDELRLMLAGSPVAAAEIADFHFGLIVTQFRRDQFSAKVRRIKRRGARSLLFVGMVLITLNFLFCMAYALFRLALEAPTL